MHPHTLCIRAGEKGMDGGERKRGREGEGRKERGEGRREGGRGKRANSAGQSVAQKVVFSIHTLCLVTNFSSQKLES